MSVERSQLANKQSGVQPAHRAPTAKPAIEPQLQAGNQAMQRLLHSGALQAKLSVSQPGDSSEQEADRVADTVMRMSERAPAEAPNIQRKCAACEDESEAGRYRERGDGASLVQRMSSANVQPSISDETQSHVRSALANGQPLSSSARSFLEPRFGRNLGHISVHTGQAAADSAQALNAKAYTVGSNIAFASGEYQPETRQGQRLLAHEITHTFQQGRGGATDGQVRRTIGDGHDLQSPRFALDVILEACFDNERTVQRGTNDNGVHVMRLQQSLIDMGYTLPGFGVDGIYGKETEASVKVFQQDAGARLVDGIVGPETMGLFDRHDTLTPNGIGPPQRLGPVPGPRPAPNATCDTPYTGVTFALANQVGSGVTPAAAISLVGAGGGRGLRMQGIAPANYTPDITINAPNDAVAQQFQVGFASNLLTEFVEYFYDSATTLVSTLPTPTKDGRPLRSGLYDPVYVETQTPTVNEDFLANGDTRSLVWPDVPSEFAFINSARNPECGAGTRPGTLATAAFIDSFRTWVVVRHRPSGCTRALHHIDWDLDWQVIVNQGPPMTLNVVRNVINVTEPNGDGQIAFIQGGQVPDDLLAANRICS